MMEREEGEKEKVTSPPPQEVGAGEQLMVGLPLELAYRVLGLLPVADLCKVGGVCQAWRTLSSDPEEMCCDVWPPVNIEALNLRSEVIEAMQIKWEWNKERMERINRARKIYAVSSCIPLSSTIRNRYNLVQNTRANIIVVGDEKVGKTSLLNSWCFSSFSDEPDAYPTRNLIINEHPVVVNVRELSKNNDNLHTEATFSLMRNSPCAVLLCYSVVDPMSLEKLRTTAVRDLAQYYPGVPYILVGCKRDLLSDEATLLQLKRDGIDPVYYEQAQAVAFELGASAFVECSAALGEGVDQPFELAAAYTIFEPLYKPKWDHNCILQ